MTTTTTTTKLLWIESHFAYQNFGFFASPTIIIIIIIIIASQRSSKLSVVAGWQNMCSLNLKANRLLVLFCKAITVSISRLSFYNIPQTQKKSLSLS